MEGEMSSKGKDQTHRTGASGEQPPQDHPAASREQPTPPGGHPASAEGGPPRNGDVEKRYAAILQWFVIGAFALLLASFVLFGAGILPAAVPAERVPELWGLSAREYSRETAFPTDWAWVRYLGNGDVLNLAALALIGAATPICFVALAVMYLRRRDYAYALMAFLVIAVLVIAASGLVGVE